MSEFRSTSGPRLRLSFGPKNLCLRGDLQGAVWTVDYFDLANEAMRVWRSSAQPSRRATVHIEPDAYVISSDRGRVRLPPEVFETLLMRIAHTRGPLAAQVEAEHHGGVQ